MASKLTPIPPPALPTTFFGVYRESVQVEKRYTYKKPNRYSPTCIPYGWSSSDDDDVDPVDVDEEEYCRQIDESDGFDVNLIIPYGVYIPYDLTNEDLHDDIGIYGRVGLHWYNFQKGSNLKLVNLVKYVAHFRHFRGCDAYYITMEVKDPANDSHFHFQTCVVSVPPYLAYSNKIITEVCRIKDKPDGSTEWPWNYIIKNGFNDGKNLEWLPDDALTGDKQKQYYEVQESDIQENDWLNLYTEYAFFANRGKPDLPLKIKKVVVQTHEDVEPSKKLMSGNAIFYIIYTHGVETKDFKAIVKRSTDGCLGHVTLDTKLDVLSNHYHVLKSS